MPEFCAICGGRSLAEVPGFRALPRVTSDTKPFPPGGRLAVCEDCGGIQKPSDAGWRTDCARIYRDYDMYAQSAGVEQAVFDAQSGGARRRSLVVAERFLGAFPAPDAGRLLDVGCGTGVTLRAFAELRPHWQLYAHDLDDRNLPELRAIPRFASLSHAALDHLEGEFELITLIHVLEHLEEPAAALRALTQRLSPGGRLLVQVPDVEENPFDLVVADHRCHFDARTLRRLAERAGCCVEGLSRTWLPKELSLVLSRGEGAPLSAHASDARERVLDQVAWLSDVLARARAAAAHGKFGIFGTSVAATWLCGALPEQTAFFIDEDPCRIGRAHLGRPILAASELPAGADVFVALVPAVAQSVAARLGHIPTHLHLPGARGT